MGMQTHEQATWTGPPLLEGGSNECKKFVSDVDCQIGLITTAICIEPVVHVTDWFIKCSSDARDRKQNLMLDTMLPQESVLTRGLQYLASLYFDAYHAASRCWLLTSWLGFTRREDHLRGRREWKLEAPVCSVRL